MTPRLILVHCVVETTGCPEEGMPFEETIKGVHRTKAAAQQAVLVRYGRGVVEERWALDYQPSRGLHPIYLLAGESHLLQELPRRRPKRRKRRRR